MAIFSKIFVIAEMANSHEGDLETAKKITESASLAGADAIKYQKFTADELARPDHENYSLYKRLEMSMKEWRELIKYAKQKKLKVFVDVFGVKSARDISKLNIDGYKIHSADLSNPYLLEFLSSVKKPILVSAAGSKLNEIDEALRILQRVPKEIVLMHGFQGYPTKLEDLNLSRISEIKKRYDLPVGLMDHIDGDSEMATIIPLLGLSLGATVIEKHITLDRSKKGLDYYSALNPSEFKNLTRLVQKSKSAFGSSSFEIKGNELVYRLGHKKNPIAKGLIKKHTLLNAKLFEFKRTKDKNSVSYYDFRGKTSRRDIPKGATLLEDMIDDKPRRVVAVIACRVDSTRLYAKPLHLVGRYTILELLIKQIMKSKLITDIVLAISKNPGNEAFIEFAKQHNLKYVTGDDTDVLKRLIDGAKYVNANVIFRITSENPYIYWEGIDPAIRKHESKNFDFTYMDGLPLGTYFEIINLKALEYSHRKGSRRHRSELATLYIKENKKQFRINQMIPEKELQRPEVRLTVDSPEDLWVAREIQSAFGNTGRPIPLKRIIKFLDKHPEIAKVNSQVPLGVSRIWY